MGRIAASSVLFSNRQGGRVEQGHVLLQRRCRRGRQWPLWLRPRLPLPGHHTPLSALLPLCLSKGVYHQEPCCHRRDNFRPHLTIVLAFLPYLSHSLRLPRHWCLTPFDFV